MSGADPIGMALDAPALAPQMAEAGELVEAPARDRPPFPPGSPVKPLGMMCGLDGTQMCYYRDGNGQITGLKAGNGHGKNAMIALFGPRSDWLEEHFPQWSAPRYEGRGSNRQLVKPSEIIGFDQADASRALIEECARKGIFDPSGRMRGRGAHQNARGDGLVLHCGDKLFVSRHRATGTIKGWDWVDPDLYERFVYPAGEAIPRPWHHEMDGEPAAEVLAMLQTWNWLRPKLDPQLIIGGIGAGMIGGALSWRPMMWITGGAGTGKSTLNGQNGMIHRLFGEGLFRTGNASAAGIRQSLKNSTLPVMLDEAESGKNNDRIEQILELARVSASGDNYTRGGADHSAQQFTLRSAFWFSSILIPPMEPQDLSRFAICQLRPLRADVAPLNLANAGLADKGRMIMRRMVDGWPRLADTKNKFHAALALRGHSARACDQFATLLACADVALNDWMTSDALVSDEEVDGWAMECAPQRLAEVSEAKSDPRQCLEHLATSQVQARGGDVREMLASWIAKAIPVYENDSAMLYDDRLQQLGLKLVNPNWKAGAGSGRWGAEGAKDHKPIFLAVANNHRALDGLFAMSKWPGGVWKQSLERFDYAIAGVTIKFARIPMRATLVPLCHLIDADELPRASWPGAIEEWSAANRIQTHEGAEA